MNVSDTKAERKPYFDNIKGILIILVVFAHCLFNFQTSTLPLLILNTIYVFHMPAFVFISGYLSKSTHSRSKEALLRLFVSYLLFNTALIFYSCAADQTGISLLSPYYSAWYLLALMVWRLVCEKMSRIKHALLLSVAAALLAGFFPDLGNVFAAARIVAFFPFFLAGFLLPEEKVSSLLQNRKPSYYIKGFLLLAVGVFLAFFSVFRYFISTSALMMSAYQTFSALGIRMLTFTVSAMIILGLFLCLPNHKIPLLTKIGKNTFAVFLLHRIPVLVLSKFPLGSDRVILLVSFILTVVLVFLFSMDIIARPFERLINFLAGVLSGTVTGKNAHLVKTGTLTIAFSMAFFLALTSLLGSLDSEFGSIEPVSTETVSQSGTPNRIYLPLTEDKKQDFSDDLTILFTGDLILLEDQVKRAYTGEDYDFSEIFEYTHDYISAADIAIGVLEGPVAGKNTGYSIGNFDDGKNLVLNFPDEFVYAVKDAGFDLVTTANNHLLDKGVPGALHTLDVLDTAGLDHLGSYRNTEEKESVKIVEKDGVKIAVLAYTYGTNGYTEEELLNEKFSYLTCLTLAPDSPNFDAVKALVEADFARAKAQNPDLILVLPHMGTQFTDFPDSYQETWNEIFLSLGADIILNDHTHSVQPVEIFLQNETRKVIVNCPGNFANVYREQNGDASAMVEVYIDKKTKTVTGAAVIPLYTNSVISGNYRALPIYEILNNEKLRQEISTYEMERIETVSKHITKTMLGVEIPCDSLEERLFLTEDGYLASPVTPLTLTPELEVSPLYQKLVSAESVCFVGDSVTEGSKNGGFGWYRPLETFADSVTESAEGGGTTKTILPFVPPASSLYVVALGTNDVRYRDESICAMTPDEYLAQFEEFVARIRKANPDAEFVFIAPWLALENDQFCALPDAERDRLLNEYAQALEQWCKENGHLYSNPNPAIREVFAKEMSTEYLLDYIHPNRTKGIALYSMAVLKETRNSN